MSHLSVFIGYAQEAHLILLDSYNKIPLAVQLMNRSPRLTVLGQEHPRTRRGDPVSNKGFTDEAFPESTLQEVNGHFPCLFHDDSIHEGGAFMI